MEYQLKLLEIFDKQGFSKVVDLMDELLNNEDILLNFIILNMDSINNIKYLCNFLKKDIDKYKSIINKIISDTSIISTSKEIFLLNLLNEYNEKNILLLNDNSMKIIIDNMKINNILAIIVLDEFSALNDIILYKILNNDIFNVDTYKNNETFYKNYTHYYMKLFSEILNNQEDLFIEWLFNICYIYNYRCKTYSSIKLNDNILFILLECVIEKYNTLMEDKILEKNNILFNVIDKNIKLDNIKLDDIKNYEKNVIYEILILNLLRITIPPSLDEINQNNLVIADYNFYINSINENNSILNSFDYIKNYVIANNKKIIDKYYKYNTVLYNKLNRYLLEKIYNFYINTIYIFINKKCDLENNELFSTFVTNIVDFYIFYNKNFSFIYNSLSEKSDMFHFFADIFNSKSTNINLDIKLVEFFNNIYLNEGVFINGNRDIIDIINILDKSFDFYVKLDKYDEYYKYNTKYKIVYLYNCLFNTPYILHENMCKILEKKNNISRFLISFVEDLHIFVNNFIVYYKLYLTNKDYGKLANTYYIYIEDYIRYYKYILKKHISKIDSDIINISIHKLNKNFVDLHKLCKEKNNIYKTMLYIIDIYLLLDKTDYMQTIKKDVISFDYKNFCEIYENMNSIYKHKNITLFGIFIYDIENLVITEEIEYTDIPEDYLDPLYNTLIEIPVLLPSSQKYVDYEVIKKHLLYHNFDPFNRDALTLEQLDEYNSKSEINEKNNLFQKEIEAWKNK